jgi:hypothetical protein
MSSVCKESLKGPYDCPVLLLMVHISLFLRDKLPFYNSSYIIFFYPLFSCIFVIYISFRTSVYLLYISVFACDRSLLLASILVHELFLILLLLHYRIIAYCHHATTRLLLFVFNVSATKRCVPPPRILWVLEYPPN